MNKGFNPSALSEFARHYGFHYDIINPPELLNDALVEMERGLRGEASSFPMIPAYISPSSRSVPGKIVIALDAGGTNLRAALVGFDERGKPSTLESRKAPMPGTRGRLDPDAFFDEIAELAAPLFREAGSKVDGVGFCFSYPMEITKEADGILLGFSKEVDAPEVIGRAIGEGLRKALEAGKIRAPERIVLLNDTVAAMLSGFSMIPERGGLFKGDDNYGVEEGTVVGFILGTGINTAYAESRIPKIGFDSPESPQIVVCECGNYSHKYMGLLDAEFDSTTKNPGAYTLEKLCSGAYLGPLSFHILSRAVKDGLLSFRKSDEFLSWASMQTKDLNAFMLEPLSGKGAIGELFGKDERDALSSFAYIVSIVTERAAFLSSAMAAAAVIKAEASLGGIGHDPFVPLKVAVEGTTYVIYKGMRSAVDSYMRLLLNMDKPRSFAIVPVEQASLFGAAVAALSDKASI